MNTHQKENMFFASLTTLVFIFLLAVPFDNPPYLVKVAYVVSIMAAIAMTVLSGIVMLYDEFKGSKQ